MMAVVEVEIEVEDNFAKGTPVHYNNGDILHDFETCQVCLLPSSPYSFVTFDKCGHSFCCTCVRTTYDSHVKDGKVSLTCLQCSQEATPIIIKDNLSPELYHKYLDYTLRQYLALEPNVRQCTAPDCPFAYIIDNPSNCEDDHFVCKRAGCDTEYCVKCKGAWHEGISCKKARKNRKKDKVVCHCYSYIYYMIANGYIHYFIVAVYIVYDSVPRGNPSQIPMLIIQMAAGQSRSSR